MEGLLNEVYWALKFVKAKRGNWGSPKGDDGYQPGMGGVCTARSKCRRWEKGERKKYIWRYSLSLAQGKSYEFPNTIGSHGCRGSCWKSTSTKFGLEHWGDKWPWKEISPSMDEGEEAGTHAEDSTANRYSNKEILLLHTFATKKPRMVTKLNHRPFFTWQEVALLIRLMEK